MAKKILVIDDEPDILKIAIFRLRKAGYEVISAEEGKTGLELASKEKPDLILLDLRLPEMDGFEICRRLKSDSELKDIPVIFFTASTSQETIEEIRKSEAVDYLTKPFEAQELLEKVKKYIGG